jgi:natural product precursor
MKKTLKKLTLSRESIRRLSGNELEQVQGGVTLGTCGAACATRPVTCATCLICQP